MRPRENTGLLQIAVNKFSLPMPAKIEIKVFSRLSGGADVPSVGCPIQCKGGFSRA